MFKRLKRMPAEGVVRYAALLSLIVFLGWIVFVFILTRIFTPPDSNTDVWSALEGISSAAAFALAIGGGVVVLVQLNESVDGRNLSIFTEVFEKLMSQEQEDARRWIYQELPPVSRGGIAQLSPEDRQKIRTVLNVFDYLGFLIRQEWVTEEATETIVDWVNPLVVKVWAKLGPYIDVESGLRDEPDYYLDVRNLAEHCIKWRRENYPDREIVWLDDAL